TLRTRFNYHFPEDLCETPIVHYKLRRDDPADSFEDIIKICFFYSIPVLIESVQGGQAAISYFDKRGYGKFVMRRPKSTFTRKDDAQDKPGTPMNAGVIEQMSNLAASDINKNGRKFRQIEIVEDA